MGWVLVKTYEYPYMGIFLWGGTRARIDRIVLQGLGWKFGGYSVLEWKRWYKYMLGQLRPRLGVPAGTLSGMEGR